jgi:hypothetical protein
MRTRTQTGRFFLGLQISVPASFPQCDHEAPKLQAFDLHVRTGETPGHLCLGHGLGCPRGGREESVLCLSPLTTARIKINVEVRGRGKLEWRRSGTGWDGCAAGLLTCLVLDN